METNIPERATWRRNIQGSKAANALSCRAFTHLEYVLSEPEKNWMRTEIMMQNHHSCTIYATTTTIYIYIYFFTCQREGAEDSQHKKRSRSTEQPTIIKRTGVITQQKQ